MPQVRVVKIIFDTILKNHEIPAFRGAVINMVGRDQVAFHNHLADEKFVYSYPVIQYKTHGKRAGIVCLDSGVEQIHEFFSNNTGEIFVGTQRRSWHVESVKINMFQVCVSDKTFTYDIKSWLPLNEKNFVTYRRLEGLQDRVQFLERLLIGNILSFAKGIQWTIDKKIEIKICDIGRQFWVSHKGVRLQAFDLQFKTNVFLPYDIGLGKGVSLGFGTLYKEKTTHYHE